MTVFKSVLSPSQSVATGVGIGVVDLFIFDRHLPAMADIRTADPQDTDIDASRRAATGQCIAINALVFLMTRDWNVFLIGGAITASMSWLVAHANTVHPATGSVVGPADTYAPTASELSDQYAMPSYEDTNAGQ